MKLFAVTLKAGLVINGDAYPERQVCVSKFAAAKMIAALEHDGAFRAYNQPPAPDAYAPAVFTCRSKAEKLVARMPAAIRGAYIISEFDSDYFEYPVAPALR